MPLTRINEVAPLTADAPAAARTRDGIEAKYKWDLVGIFATLTDFEKAFAAVELEIAKVAKLAGSLATSPQALLTALKFRDQLYCDLEKVLLFAGLSHHEDMSVGTAQARWDTAHTLSTRAAEATSWFLPEILAISPQTISGWVAATPDLAVYRHALEDISRQRAHCLSTAEERLLAMAGEIAAAPETVYSRFTNTNLDFPTIKDADGKDIRLTQGLYGALIYSPDRRVRRDAFIALHETYQAKTNTLSALLAAQVKQHIFFARARNFSTCLQCALDGPNIPVGVYDNLIASVRRHVDKLHRYVSIRARMLKIDDVHGYDLYVPMLDAPDEKVPYDEAMQTVIEALAPLGGDYQTVLRQAATSRWIDVYETPNKRSGAYSWGSYLTHPYLLLNYNGTQRDVSTLAHELGHAMHSWYTTRTQPPIYGDYATFCAEVASTVNEVLLAHDQLARASDPRRRLMILQQQIESIRTTVFRQTMFAEYERDVHARSESGEALTGDYLCDHYAELLKVYYGPQLVIDDCAKAEGLRIPHFYRNFYVYTYATSHCAATAIGARIAAGKPGAVEAFKTFLSAGSSRYPLDVLKLAGVDLSNPEPIEATMLHFAKLLDEFEALASAV